MIHEPCGALGDLPVYCSSCRRSVCPALGRRQSRNQRRRFFDRRRALTIESRRDGRGEHDSRLIDPTSRSPRSKPRRCCRRRGFGSHRTREDSGASLIPEGYVLERTVRRWTTDRSGDDQPEHPVRRDAAVRDADRAFQSPVECRSRGIVGFGNGAKSTSFLSRPRPDSTGHSLGLPGQQTTHRQRLRIADRESLPRWPSTATTRWRQSGRVARLPRHATAMRCAGWRSQARLSRLRRGKDERRHQPSEACATSDKSKAGDAQKR